MFSRLPMSHPYINFKADKRNHSLIIKKIDFDIPFSESSFLTFGGSRFSIPPCQTADEFVRKFNSSHGELKVVVYNDDFLVLPQLDFGVGTDGIYEVDGSYRRVVGNTLTDFVLEDFFEDPVRFENAVDSSLAKSMVGSVLAAKFDYNDNSGLKRVSVDDVAGVYQQEDGIMKLQPHGYFSGSISSDVSFTIPFESFIVYSPYFQFGDCEFQVKAGVLVQKGFETINSFDDSNTSEISFELTNSKLSVFASLTGGSKSEIMRSSTTRTIYNFTGKNQVGELMIARLPKRNTSITVGSDGVLAFGFKSKQSSTYLLLRDGRFKVELQSDVLFINDQSTSYSVAQDKDFILHLEKEGDDIDYYIYDENSNVTEGTVTSSFADIAFQTGDCYFSKIICCELDDSYRALQLVHDAFPRIVQLSNHTFSNSTLTYNNKVYRLTIPRLSRYLTQLLGVDQSVRVAQSGNKVTKYSEPERLVKIDGNLYKSGDTVQFINAGIRAHVTPYYVNCVKKVKRVKSDLLLVYSYQ